MGWLHRVLHALRGHRAGGLRVPPSLTGGVRTPVDGDKNAVPVEGITDEIQLADISRNCIDSALPKIEAGATTSALRRRADADATPPPSLLAPMLTAG